MRWNGRERSVGYLVFLCTLITGAMYADGLEAAAARARPGMSRGEVAAALGAGDQPSRTRFGFFCVTLRPDDSPEQARFRQRLIDEYAAANRARYREYQLFLCVVDVEFDPDKGVVSVVSHRSMTEAWFLTPWPLAAVAAGLVAAEAARRRRSATVPPESPNA